VLLPVAMFVRESTILFCLVLAGVLWRAQFRRYTVLILAVILLSAGVSRAIAATGQPDTHRLGTVAYMIFKVPYNISKNFFGVELWTNTYAELPMWQGVEPEIKVTVPTWLPLGGIR